MIQFETATPKIAIFRALQLGDMICAVPAMRALRTAFPEAEIVLIGLPWAASFVQRFSHYFDRLIVFPGYPGLPEQPFDHMAWTAFQEQLQAEQFDCIIQMQGNGTIVNEMLTELGAQQLAGFYLFEDEKPSAHFMKYPGTGSEIMRHLSLMQFLGIPSGSAALEFPVYPAEENSLRQIAPFVGQQPYVCVHPGSRAGWRQWAPPNFAMLANYCAEQGLQIVFTGTADETPIIAEVQKWLQHDAINLAGKTKLGEVAALLKNASLLIANCTGVSHIAAAVQTPSLIISMDGEPDRWGPLNRSLHKVIDWTTHPSLMTVYNELLTLVTEVKRRKAV